MPMWASFNKSTGTLSGTPGLNWVGTYQNVQIQVTDGRNWATLPAFAITVVAPTVVTPPLVDTSNNPPTISGTPPASATVGQTYTFRPTAADADGDRLTFSVQGNPAWLMLNGADGTLSGIPTAANVGTSSGIVINVSDGKVSTSLPAFSISVTDTNRAPTISGSPPTSARAGQPYAFRPTAADADGDTLTFRVQGKPAWATFDTTDGTLSGTPTAADVGLSSSVVISVSDGTTATSLPAFSITVAQALTTSARVSWRAPTTNVDGTPITALAGFRVLYGNTSGQYGQSLLVSSPSITSVVIEGLTPSTTWYFVVKSVAASGVESDYSTEASKAM
jgi:hypothetical protein